MKLLLGCGFCGLRDLEPRSRIGPSIRPVTNACQSANPAGIRRLKGTGGRAVFDPVLHRWASAPVSLKIQSYSCMEFMRLHKVQSGRAKCDPSVIWMDIIQAIDFQESKVKCKKYDGGHHQEYVRWQTLFAA